MSTPRVPTRRPRSAQDPVASVHHADSYLRRRLEPDAANLLVLIAGQASKPRVPLPKLREAVDTLRSAHATIRMLGESRLTMWPASPESDCLTLADQLDALAADIEHATSHALCFDFDPLFESDGRLLYAFLAMKYAALMEFPLPSVTLLMAGAVAGALEPGTENRDLRHEQWRKRRRVALELFKDYAADFHFSLLSLKNLGGRLRSVANDEGLEALRSLASHRWTSDELDHLEARDEARAARGAAAKYRGSDGCSASAPLPVTLLRRGTQYSGDEAAHPRESGNAARPRHPRRIVSRAR